MNITHNQHKKNKKVYTGILLVCLAVLSVLLACEEAGTEEKNRVVSVDIIDDQGAPVGDFTLAEGNTKALKTTEVAFGTAKNQGITWETGNEEVASVVDGLVTAKKIGETTITARSVANPDVKKEITVTVPGVKSVALALPVTIDIGAKVTVTAIVVAVGGVPKTTKFAETDENGNAVTPTGIVTLDNKDGLTLVLTGKKPGNTWIVTTSTEDPKKKSAAIPITVNGVVSVDIIDDRGTPVGDFSLIVGNTKSLETTEEAFGTAKNKGVTWISGNEQFITVIAGLVTAKKIGETTITAKSVANPDVKKEITVRVNPVPVVNSVTLALVPPATSPIDKGTAATMTATIDAVGTAVGTAVTFAETDVDGKAVTPTGIVTLDASNSNGRTLVVTGEKPGDTWIVASSTFDDTKKSAAIPITVNGVVSITIEQSSFSFVVGTEQQLSTTEEAYGTAKNKGVMWSSSKENFATVDTNGLVKAVAEGEATITATSNIDPNERATVKVKVVEKRLPLYYAEVRAGRDSIGIPVVYVGTTIDTYNLRPTGTGTGTPELPEINPNTGEITVTTTTSAGTYTIIATAGTETFEAMFYVTITPTIIHNEIGQRSVISAISRVIEAGIENFGPNADFNYIKLDKTESLYGLFCPDVNLDSRSFTNSRPYVKNFNGDISKWDTRHISHVSGMEKMFYNNTAFNGDISNWDVRKVTTMQWMFYNNTAFNGDISKWDVRKVTNMEKMFKNATAFTQDLEIWGTKLPRDATTNKITTTTTDMFFGSALANNLPTWYKK